MKVIVTLHQTLVIHIEKKLKAIMLKLTTDQKLEKSNFSILFIIFLFFFIHPLFSQTKETLSDLNLRVLPSKNSLSLGLIPAHTKIVILGEDNLNWTHIEYNGIKGYASSSFLRDVDEPYSNWSKLDYKTGQEPDCENYDIQYDVKSEGLLRIFLSENSDCVIKVMNNNNGKCIRIAYIRSGDSFEMKNIPKGTYYLKLAYGKDFRKGIVNEKCVVKFVENAIYELGSEKLRIDDINYGYELYLGVSEKELENEFNTKPIDEKLFNN